MVVCSFLHAACDYFVVREMYCTELVVFLRFNKMNPTRKTHLFFNRTALVVLYVLIHDKETSSLESCVNQTAFVIQHCMFLIQYKEPPLIMNRTSLVWLYVCFCMQLVIML